MEELHAVQKEIFRFIRRVPRIMEEDLKEEFSNLRDRLLKHESDPYERRPFLYLDIISWLEAKVSDRTVEAVAQEKAQARYAIEPEG
jgi:hypothetical protein